MDRRRQSALEAFSSVSVQRGLYVLRYVSAVDEIEPPSAEIHVPADADTKVRLIAAPGEAPGFLAHPGKCLVVVAEEQTAITIGLRAGRPGGSLETIIRLEPLEMPIARETEVVSTSDVISSAPPQSSRLSSASEVPSVALVAHISRRGDVAVEPDVWAAGPEAPSAIEGLIVNLDKPDGLKVQVQALIGVGAKDWTSWVDAGAFVGTKGKAQPLTGLRFRIDGPKSIGLRLDIDAMFLGSPIVSRRGRLVELTSGTGSDPLVGLRVKLGREDPDFTSLSANNGRDVRSKIRIFRSGAQNQR